MHDGHCDTVTILAGVSDCCTGSTVAGKYCVSPGACSVLNEAKLSVFNLESALMLQWAVGTGFGVK